MNHFTFPSLLKAYYQCRQSKRKSRSAAEFELRFERNLLQMEQDLKNQTYQCGRYICFAISDPKIREVWAADFRDRVVHHLLVSYLELIWEKMFVFHSYACRKEKGVHKSIRYLKKIIAPNLFFLQADIQSFFVSIDKCILFSLIKKHVKNPEILWLTKKIIYHDPTTNYIQRGNLKLLQSVPPHKSLFDKVNCGLPIGNFTSQFFANVYLNELDQFIKHSLKCRHYFRYMDDLLLLHSSKEQLLKWHDDIKMFLEITLKLKLHPKKQFLQPATNGINFCGYIIKPDHTLSRRRIVSSLKKKLHYFNKAMDSGVNPWPENNLSYQPSLPLLFPDELPELELIKKAQSVINSYYGHFRHAHCKKLRIALYSRYFKNLKKYLDPADKNFSHFVINSSIKKSYQEKNRDY